MKKPQFLTKFAAIMTPRPRKKYRAIARAAHAPADGYDEEEPTTKLSSAFIVVLILHVVAVGGIYAFNSIKASRRNHEQTLASMNAVPAVQAKSPVATEASPAPRVPGQAAAAPHSAAAHPAEPATVAASSPAAASASKPGALRQYPVKAGDNATKIAFAYGVTAAELLAANNLKDGAVLRVGQTLTIPAPKAAAKSAAAEVHKADATVKPADVAPTKTTPGLYVVKKGDTAHSIARSFGLSVDELLKLNKITDPKKLQLGQSLKLPPRKS